MTPRPQPLVDADFDVVIIGGGIAGAGVARDLAMRGLAVALLDRGDFGAATTSRSSKLVHGGLRYLELFDFALVRESLTERERLRRLAPHLVTPLPFLVPIYRDSTRGLIKVRIGLMLYDWLTPGRDRERYQSTSDDRMIFVIPWREFSLVGTTDTDFDGDLDRVHATRDEVDYLLGEARKALPDPRVRRDEVVYTYAGVRPLSYEEGTS